MKEIEVVAAVIRREGRIFATQRGYGEWKDWWEFPGGKMEADETPEEALRREIREELSAEIGVDRLLCTVEWDYTAFHLTMHCYLCTLLGDSLHLNEHEAARWLSPTELDSVRWLPADVQVIEQLKNKGGMYIAFAPLQGYTDAVYRRAHHECVGGVDEYYTPFVRIEHGEVRRKELRDTDPERNAGVPTVPQVIAKDGDEFARLCDALQGQGWRRIDLNMGCPFPMQVKAGRGSGLLQHPEHVEEIVREMERRPEVVFSVKMRLGQEHEDEGLAAIPIINEMPLVHVTLHPRLGRQQYKGVADREAFQRFMEVCRHPMVYNGDIGLTPHPPLLGREGEPTPLKGVMIGRGLLARPWMLSDKEPQEVITSMHDRIYRHAVETLCGDSQILARLHAFWEYLDIPHKQQKAIMKATTLPRYREAVAAVIRGL
ncbi:MAG: tRNA-dihydrouridine synthase [Bacteroidales bacterium]|nr:tRNA-dihydrouridine synthase [Bacteroidales bacterium]